MLELAPTRPAARSAAVRPRSASSSSPRPASTASPWQRSLFLCPSPRPIGKQSSLVAGPCSHSGWEQSGAWEQLWEHQKRACSVAYATVPTVPSLARARVMRARTHAIGSLSLSLGTWEHLSLVFAIQRLALFPRLFPASAALGTWEQASADQVRSQPLTASGIKLGAGYGALRLASGDAGANFRASIAAGELELGRICAWSTRARGNGGNPPFLSASIGHVGRAMLEGCAYVPEITPQSDARLKLRRLRQEAVTLRSPARHPGTPNRARASGAGQPMDALRFSFELRSGLLHDCSNTALKNRRQNLGRQQGPGEARFSNESKIAGRWRNREDGMRAGVISPLACKSRPHEAREGRTLGREFTPVNGGC